MNPPTYRYSRRRDREVDDMCFGGRSRTIWPLIIGVFIILIGLSSLLDRYYYWASFEYLWPIFLIAVGLLIIFGRSRRY